MHTIGETLASDELSKINECYYEANRLEQTACCMLDQCTHSPEALLNVAAIKSLAEAKHLEACMRLHNLKKTLTHGST